MLDITVTQHKNHAKISPKTTTMSAFELNNQAIRELKDGSYVAAVQTFQQALHRMRDVLCRDCEAKGPASPVDRQCEQMQTEEADCIVVPTDASKDSSNTFSSRYENHFAMFDGAFRMPLSLTENDVLESADVENFASSCLLYNLGLAYHKKGLIDGSSRQLQQAMGLYKKSAILLEYLEEQEEHTMLLLLAIMNNMGHIYAEQYDIKEAGNCIDSLQYLLDTDECQLLLDEDHYNFFYWSFFLFPEKPVFFAAAA